MHSRSAALVIVGANSAPIFLSLIHILMDGTMVRILSWYDNEWGFSNRMADTAVAMGKLI